MQRVKVINTWGQSAQTACAFGSVGTGRRGQSGHSASDPSFSFFLCEEGGVRRPLRD